MITATKTDIKREFQRIFEFVVKHKGNAITKNATNAHIKKVLRWAWYYEKLFIIFDGTRIVSMAVAWRTDHPENNYRDMSFFNTEIGDYISVYCVVVHPDYRNKGMMLPLLGLVMKRFPGANKIFWAIHARGLSILKITTTEKLTKGLIKWLKVRRYQK